MELLINTPQVPEYQWNYEEIKAAALAKAKEYSSIAYTSADETAMKKDKADLNRIINQIEDERKRIKKACMAPYDAFEAQVKEVLRPLRDAVDYIDKGLAGIDASYRQAKTDQMKALYEEVYLGIRDIVPFEKTVKEEYFKKAYTEKKLDKAYREMAAQVNTDLEAIRTSVAQPFQAAAYRAYLVNFSLSEAQSEVYRLQALSKQLEARRIAEEERQKQLEEQRQKALAEIAAAKEAAAAKQAAEREEAAKAAAEHAQAKTQAEAQAQAQEAVADEPILEYGPILCRGTKTQLLGLAAYIKANKIECVRV